MSYLAAMRAAEPPGRERRRALSAAKVVVGQCLPLRRAASGPASRRHGRDRRDRGEPPLPPADRPGDAARRHRSSSGAVHRRERESRPTALPARGRSATARSMQSVWRRAHERSELHDPRRSGGHHGSTTRRSMGWRTRCARESSPRSIRRTRMRRSGGGARRSRQVLLGRRGHQRAGDCASPSSSPTFPPSSARSSASAKPVVAAVHGLAMGGGARARARLPLPGRRAGHADRAPGGEARDPSRRRRHAAAAPRLVGLETRSQPDRLRHVRCRRRSCESGALFDEVIEGDLLDGAVAFATQVIAAQRPLPLLRDVPVKHPDAEAFVQFARNSVAAVAKGLSGAAQVRRGGGRLAPGRSRRASLVERAALHRARQTRRSRRRCATCSSRSARPPRSPTSRRTRPRAPSRSARGDRRGHHGRRHRHELRQRRHPGAAAGGEAGGARHAASPPSARTTRATSKKGKLTAAQVERAHGADHADASATTASARRTSSSRRCSRSMAVKEDVFRQLDEVMKPGAILATNTSTLDVEQDRRASPGGPQDVIGTHFFSPANVMKLLEIVRGAATAKDVLATVMAAGEEARQDRRWSRGCCDGFIGNRMLAQYSRQALLPASRRARRRSRSTRRSRSSAWRWARSGWPTSPATTSAGASASAATPSIPDGAQPVIADRLCEMGRFGQKTGAGLVPLRGRASATPSRSGRRRADRRASARDAGVTRRKITDEEIVERCVSRWSTRARGSSRRGSRSAPPTSTSCTSPATASRPSAAGRCTTRTRVGLYNVVRAMRRFAANPHGDPRFWKPAPLLAQARRRKASPSTQPGDRPMTDAVIVSTARTGLAKSWRGALNMTHGATLGGHVVQAAVERAKHRSRRGRGRDHGLRPARGHHRRQHRAADRAPRRASRSPPPATTVNRFCSSGCRPSPSRRSG